MTTLPDYYLVTFTTNERPYGMTWNDLRLILLTLGVVVAFYVFLAFGVFAPAGY